MKLWKRLKNCLLCKCFVVERDEDENANLANTGELDTTARSDVVSNACTNSSTHSRHNSCSTFASLSNHAIFASLSNHLGDLNGNLADGESEDIDLDDVPWTNDRTSWNSRDEPGYPGDYFDLFREIRGF